MREGTAGFVDLLLHIVTKFQESYQAKIVLAIEVSFLIAHSYARIQQLLSFFLNKKICGANDSSILATALESQHLKQNGA